MCGGKTEQMVRLYDPLYRLTPEQIEGLKRKLDEAFAYAGRAMVQLAKHPLVRQMARQYVAEEDRKGLPKKPRHHDHLLQRHIRSPQRANRRP